MNSIAKYRKKAGLSQGQLAEEAQIGGQSCLSNYERGDRPVSLDALKAIREALRKHGVKVTLDDLAKAS